MAEIDIVIAHRGPEIGLWLTLSSCTQILNNDKHMGPEISAKFYIYHNGDKELDWASARLLEMLEKTGRLGYYHLDEDPVSPPTARNQAARWGSGEYIFFLDNHCIVNPGYFHHALDTFDHNKSDAVHSVTYFNPGDDPRYHYRLTLERNFWGYQTYDYPTAPGRVPYRIGVGAHGGFAIRRSVWQELGGYWDGFKGYGGEETYLGLLMGLTDKVSYLDPRMSHWHHPGIRNYPRDKSVDFVKNMLMCANLIGGETWLKRVGRGFSASDGRDDNPRNLDYPALVAEAEAATRFDRKKIELVSKRTLNEQLVHYGKIQAAM